MKPEEARRPSADEVGERLEIFRDNMRKLKSDQSHELNQELLDSNLISKQEESLKS